MKAVKVISKIILIIIVAIILFIINFLILLQIPIGIILPIGWGGYCHDYEYIGFPFSVISLPPPGTLCALSLNFLAFALNFLFLVLLTFIIYLIFKRKIIKK